MSRGENWIGRDGVLDWLARVRIGGLEAMSHGVGITERRIRFHAERLERERLLIRTRVDGAGPLMVITPRGLRRAGYVGSGEFDYVPVVHKTTDAEMGNDVELDEVPAPDPGAPDDPGSVERLLYDHLNRLQLAVRERRGAALSIDVSDEAIDVLGDAGRAGAADLNG